MVLTSPNVVCPKCGSKLFKEVYALKKISAIISHTGQEEIIPIPIYVCAQCGEVPDEYKKNRNYDAIMGNSQDVDLTADDQAETKPTIIMP